MAALVKLGTVGISKTTPGTHSVEDCVDPSADMNSLEETETKLSLPRFESRFLGRVMHSLVTVLAELSGSKMGFVA